MLRFLEGRFSSGKGDSLFLYSSLLEGLSIGSLLLLLSGSRSLFPFSSNDVPVEVALTLCFLVLLFLLLHFLDVPNLSAADFQSALDALFVFRLVFLVSSHLVLSSTIFNLNIKINKVPTQRVNDAYLLRLLLVALISRLLLLGLLLSFLLLLLLFEERRDIWISRMFLLVVAHLVF